MIEETPERPALILGTSSDRIGTPSGRSYYATLSKDLERDVGLPLAPYAGLAFGEFEDEWEVVAGLVVRWSDEWSTWHMWDGENFHNLVETSRFAPHAVGLMLAEVDNSYYLGITWSVGFALPGGR